MQCSLNLIGAGNLGKTIGCLLVKKKVVTLAGICNNSLASAKSAAAFIGQGIPCDNLAALPAADLYLLSTPDDGIESVSAALAATKALQPGTIVFHCSGALQSDVLHAVAEQGCLVASVHPMRSFANPELSLQTYAGTYCAIEGDSEAVRVLQNLFDSIGSITYLIDKSHKALYHAAGVFASNYLLTLAEQSLSCLQASGIDKGIALGLITNLMKSSIGNLEQSCSPRESLTGPIRRGDLSTLEQHMLAFDDANMRQLYASLGKATLALTSHPEETKQGIEKVLGSVDHSFLESKKSQKCQIFVARREKTGGVLKHAEDF